MNEKRAITRREALGMLGAAALGGVALGTMTGCGDLFGEGEQAYVSPYDWACLVPDGERLAYVENGVVLSQWGIDVSEHQRAIDWTAVATVAPQFAFVRIGNRGATVGALDTDECFFSNCMGAAGARIPVSGYFFSQALNQDEAVEEARYALDRVQQVRSRGCTIQAIAYDHEAVNIEGARANDLSGAQLSQNVVAFCEEIAAAGYRAMIYGNQRDLLKLDENVRDAYPLWLAEYGVDHPSAPFDFALWQYTNAGTIPGIPTSVDLNIWLPSVDELTTRS
ncbi:GH25 family lysozyme [Adlercreutzia murintestinalis]|uniref:GH25 family lysozyme n=1 Tax=Adlercreutzia murintestinalis TaxID=2941325 RepID=UPI0020410874|nr:GH25 family lysozyme [Adlercreutzia murintestinalis]